MNRRVAAAIAAGTLAFGLLAGAAGGLVIGNSGSSGAGDYRAEMTQMMGGRWGSGMMGSGMMGSGMMGGQWDSGMMGPRTTANPQP